MQRLIYELISQCWPRMSRGLATSSTQLKRPKLPKLWLEQNHATPAVNISAFQGMQPPSALSWLRRRGPSELHHGNLYRLFRERAVRIFECNSGKVKRVSRSRILSDGDVLLWPKDAGQAHGPATSHLIRRASGALSLSPEEAKEVKEQLVINWTDHFVFVNKPAGLEVQGGQGEASLKDLTDKGVLNITPDDDLKLVHRLDKLVSGVIVLARGKDAAAYISKAFRDKSVEAIKVLSGDLDPMPEGGGLCVEKTYEALVMDHEGRLEEGQRGQVSLPVPLTHWSRIDPASKVSSVSRSYEGQSDDTALPSLTRYTVKQIYLFNRESRVALLELSPLTGRRHQLRYHCAHGLNAPIIGDVEYGSTPAAIQRIRAAFPALGSIWKGRPLPIMLHSRSIELTTRSGELQAASTAQWPPHMNALLDALTKA